MKVGIIGSGGREHALCQSLKNSSKISKIFCFPGNAGTSEIAENEVLDFNNFEDIKNFMQWPYTAITTDGGIDDAHPRGQGTYPRVLGKYVREMGILSLPEAIRKMTSLSASNLGITTRGIIKAGLAADLVLFNPETITDHATFENSLQFSTGIDSVWVNGEIAFREGASTQARPGQILKRETQ